MANFLSNNFPATESTWRHFCEAARAKTKELSIGHVNRLRIRDIQQIHAEVFANDNLYMVLSDGRGLCPQPQRLLMSHEHESWKNTDLKQQCQDSNG